MWRSDIAYFHCAGQVFYIVFIMEVCSRLVVGYRGAGHNVAALQMALKRGGMVNYGGRLIHHSDKAGQCAAAACTALPESRGIRISMCHAVYENTHIKRVNGTLKNQYPNRRPIDSKKEPGRRLQQAVKACNESRPHEGIGKLSPLRYEEKLKAIPQEKRVKMKIYTAPKQQGNFDPKQLNLFQQLS